jgi:YjjG family noncanonical pyrimidine nucleotidase
MRHYTWLLFDADGTLFDYDAAEKHALEASFVQIDSPFKQDYLAEYRRINHQIWLDFEQGKITQERLKARRFELLFDTINLHADPMEFSERYLDNLAKGTYLIDGAADILKVLENTYNLAIITNGLTRVQRPRFEKSPVSQYLKEIIISEEVGAAKPEPAIFDIAFECMDYPAKQDVLIIGDSLTSDIQGGHNYGIDTCWFNPKHHHNTLSIAPTFEIHTLSELSRLLLEQN